MPELIEESCNSESDMKPLCPTSLYSGGDKCEKLIPSNDYSTVDLKWYDAQDIAKLWNSDSVKQALSFTYIYSGEDSVISRQYGSGRIVGPGEIGEWTVCISNSEIDMLDGDVDKYYFYRLPLRNEDVPNNNVLKTTCTSRKMRPLCDTGESRGAGSSDCTVVAMPGEEKMHWSFTPHIERLWPGITQLARQRLQHAYYYSAAGGKAFSMYNTGSSADEDGTVFIDGATMMSRSDDISRSYIFYRVKLNNGIKGKDVRQSCNRVDADLKPLCDSKNYESANCLLIATRKNALDNGYSWSTNFAQMWENSKFNISAS